MKLTHVLRPAQKMLTGALVATVAATCLVSASGSGTLAKKEGPAQAPATSAMKEWHSKGTAPLVNVAQSASPAMGASTYERATLSNINRVRHAHHLRSLSFAPCANRVANRWSAHLAATNGFYHQSMTRLLRVCRAHYAGETLGMGHVSPRTMVSMWMHSPPHRHILMSRSPRRIGIGATPNAAGQWVVAANFMRF
jgi:uncharacterized protein YkwD